MSLMPGPSASLVKYTLEFLPSQIENLMATSLWEGVQQVPQATTSEC